MGFADLDGMLAADTNDAEAGKRTDANTKSGDASNTDDAAGKTADSEVSPPEDVWAKNLEANDGWPETHDNDPDNVKLSRPGNPNSGKTTGGDWAQAKSDGVFDGPGVGNNSSSNNFMMSGGNGTQGQNITTAVPDTDFHKLFTNSGIFPNNSSASIFGNEPVNYFLNSSKLNAAPNTNSNEPKKVHFNDASKNATTTTAPNVQDSGNIAPGEGNWNTSQDAWRASAGSGNNSAPATNNPDTVSGAFPDSWANGFNNTGEDAAISNGGNITTTDSNNWGNDGPTNTPAAADTGAQWGASGDSAKAVSDKSNNSVETMPGAWDSADDNNITAFSASIPDVSIPARSSTVPQTTFQASSGGANRFEQRLKANGTFDEDDIKALAFWAHHYEEVKWLKLQCMLYNTTQKAIPAEFIKAKFKEDGVEFCGKP
jgi:hypothetical protein